MSHEGIAQALGITKPTLEKHYEAELASGANLRRMDVLEKLFQGAKKGSTSAARAYLAHQPEFALGKTPIPEPKPVDVGKKGKAAADAVGAEAGTDWDGVLPAGVVPLRR